MWEIVGGLGVLVALTIAILVGNPCASTAQTYKFENEQIGKISMCVRTKNEVGHILGEAARDRREKFRFQ
jgi:hypothetical protein